MNCISGEKQSGSAALTLTKNLSHTGFVVTKFILAVVSVTLSIVIAGLICYVYTYYLFENAGKINNIIAGLVAYSMFTFTLIGVTLLASTIANSTAVTALLSFCGFTLLSFSNFVPGIGHMMPGTLLTKTSALTSGQWPHNIVWTIVVALLITVLCVFLSIHLLKKQEI